MSPSLGFSWPVILSFMLPPWSVRGPFYRQPTWGRVTTMALDSAARNRGIPQQVATRLRHRYNLVSTWSEVGAMHNGMGTLAGTMVLILGTATVGMAQSPASVTATPISATFSIVA